MAGSSRILNKLQDSIAGHHYYEAHQLLKTLNFRYTAGKRFEELESLLETSSQFLLDNSQFESGMDVAIMLVNLYKTAQFPCTEERMGSIIRLIEKMPASPERAQIIGLVVEWSGSLEKCHKLHNLAAEMYIRERCYDEAWKHVSRVSDGRVAGILYLKITQEIGETLRPGEMGLLTANLVLRFLALKQVRQAEECFMTITNSGYQEDLHPLLNGLRFLVEAAKTNDASAFKAIVKLYDPSFKRDPNLKKLVTAAGKSLFNIPDEGGTQPGGLMSLFNTLMGAS